MFVILVISGVSDNGFVLAFTYSWKLTLVIMATSPVLGVAGFVVGKILASFSSQESGAYAKAGAVAEQAISCIRTVAAFGGQDKEAAKYEQRLAEAEKKGIYKSVMAAVSIGVTMLVLFGSYSLAFWYGSTMVRAGEISAGNVVLVFFSVLIAAFSLGTAVIPVDKMFRSFAVFHSTLDRGSASPSLERLAAASRRCCSCCSGSTTSTKEESRSMERTSGITNSNTSARTSGS